MPQLNEIRIAKELGYKGTNKVIWSACEKCGKERWVFLVKGIATDRFCHPCQRYGKRRYIPKEFKKCGSCQKIYPYSLIYFKRRKLIKSGLGNTCRRCASKQKHEYRRNNLKARLSGNISLRISQTLHGKNGQHWESLVGFTIEKLIKHLESQFKNGMNWDNHGVRGWHIDHIIPIAAFHFTSPDDIDFKRCWGLSNLQPLWAEDNVAKSSKILKPFQPSLISSKIGEF